MPIHTERFTEVAAMLAESEYVLLAGHENPDGDSLGSMLGFAQALADNNPKNVTCYASDGVPASFSFLPGARNVTKAISWYPDIVVGFDYGDFKRLRLPKDMCEGARIITFDHHQEGRQRGDVKIIDTSFASTTELLYIYMEAVGWRISKETALCLLTGIVTDTGGFAHNTSARTMEIAGKLVQMGAPLQKIYERTFASKSPQVLNVWGKVLERMEKNERYNYVSVSVPFSEFKKYGIVLDDLAGMVSVLNVVADARFSIFMVEYEPGIVKGSLRSEEFKRCDVSAIAKRLGGGGHTYASGFTLAGSPEEVKRRLHAAIAVEVVAQNQ